MIQRIGSILIVGVLLISLVGISLAAGKGNARKGKYLYRKNCRACHIEGGSAKELSPISKTQAQWQKVFDETNKLACKDQWVKLSDKDRRDMFAHLHGHAYDSPSPAKCQ
jgi:hypothetical protein